MQPISRFFRPLAPESPNLLHLDALRIIAAIGVIIYHFRMTVAEPPLRLPISLAGLHMMVDLFFVLSGFVIAYVYVDRIKTRADYLDFLRKRVARLGPLHWATLALFAALGLMAALGVGPIRQSDTYDWGCLPAQAAMVHAWGVCEGASFNAPSWSISAEMGMYLLFPILIAGAARWPQTIAGVVVLILMLLEAAEGRGEWTDRTFDLGVLRALPSFMVGLLLYVGRERLGRMALGSWQVGVALVVVAAAILADAPQFLILMAIYLLAAVAVAADVGPKAVSPVFARLAPLGRLTYGVYMLHFPVQAVVIAQVAIKLLHLQGWPLVAFVAAAIPTTLAAAYVSLWLFEMPLRRLIAGRRVAAEEAVAIP